MLMYAMIQDCGAKCGDTGLVGLNPGRLFFTRAASNSHDGTSTGVLLGTAVGETGFQNVKFMEGTYSCTGGYVILGQRVYTGPLGRHILCLDVNR